MHIMIEPAQLFGLADSNLSKSDMHRVLLCAALSAGDTLVRYHGERSADILATMGCLTNMGALLSPASSCIQVRGIAGTPADTIELDCGESGSTLRFILPVAAALGCRCRVHAQGRLPQRPIEGLLALLSEHGCDCASPLYPLSLSGKLAGGTYRIEGNISSQYISGLLFALPLLGEDSRIEFLSPLESAAYVDMTIRTLARFGIHIERAPNGYAIRGGQQYHTPGAVTIEGDWSSAAFWLCAGALSGHGITCRGLSEESLQADKAIITILKQMGAQVTVNNQGVSVQKKALRALDLDMSQMPDIVPVTAVLAAVAKGTSVLRNVGRLRLKESDRLQAMLDNLTALGAEASIYGNDLVITGTPRLNGGVVNGMGDHRIIMSMAIASIACKGSVYIPDAGAVQKSYPNFFDEFNKLGGKARVL